MRNWNWKNIQERKREIYNCEPTYEELKLRIPYATTSRLYIASLPMRNWNLYFWCGLRLVGWLRAYLWGIETNPQKPCACSQGDCEPTYEELKRVVAGIHYAQYLLIASLPMRNWNRKRSELSGSVVIDCEPTYEELKPSFFCKVYASQWHCEPTYEELKLREILCNQETEGHCEPTYEELKRKSDSECNAWCLRLRAYLWGIETTVGTGIRFQSKDCEPTYEELKLISVSDSSSGFWIASLPMRNWNLVAVEGGVCSGIASLPMRNWNMKYGQKIHGGYVNCEPTYEELKLKLTPISTNQAKYCEPTYEELKLG